MPELLIKVLRVFLASPGGLEAERQAAKRIVDEVNQSHSEHWGCQIKLVGWELTLPGNHRAQSLINQDLDKCDYFVGVIWNHWGTKPTDGDSQYSSGFEEEFERASDRFEKNLMRDIALFFRDIPEAQLKDPGPSLAKVIEFRDRCVTRRRPLFKSFTEISQFEAFFRATIEKIGWREHKAIERQTLELLEPQQSIEPPRPLEQRQSDEQRLIGPSSAAFLNALMVRPSDWEAIKPVEVARLRLIAVSTSRGGNDDAYLGNHDANLLFAERENVAFDDRELLGLIDSGLAGFAHQNVPLWFWLAREMETQPPFHRAEILAIVGNEQERPSAIRVLQAAGRSTPTIAGFPREKVLSSWLMVEDNNATATAALSFLSTNGDLEDASIVEQLLERMANSRKVAASETIISILASRDDAQALSKLMELNPDTLSVGTTKRIFKHPSTIPTEVAARCLELKAETARRCAQHGRGQKGTRQTGAKSFLRLQQSITG